MSKKQTAIIITVVVLIAGIGVFLYFRNKKSKETKPVKELAEPIVLPSTPTEVPTAPVESTAVIIDEVMEHKPAPVIEPIVLSETKRVSANLSKFNFNQLA